MSEVLLWGVLIAVLVALGVAAVLLMAALQREREAVAEAERLHGELLDATAEAERYRWGYEVRVTLVDDLRTQVADLRAQLDDAYVGLNVAMRHVPERDTDD